MNSPDTVPSAVPVTPAVPDPASGRACDPPAPPPAGADPFAPDGVVFHPVSHRLITARLLGAGIQHQRQTDRVLHRDILDRGLQDGLRRGQPFGHPGGGERLAEPGDLHGDGH